MLVDREPVWRAADREDGVWRELVDRDAGVRIRDAGLLHESRIVLRRKYRAPVADRPVTASRERAMLGTATTPALSTWLGLSGIGACRGSVGWVSVVWVRLRQSVR